MNTRERVIHLNLYSFKPLAWFIWLFLWLWDCELSLVSCVVLCFIFWLFFTGPLSISILLIWLLSSCRSSMAPPRATAGAKRKESHHAASSSSKKQSAPPPNISPEEAAPPYEDDPMAPLSTTFYVPAARRKFDNCFKDTSLVQERAFPHDDPHPAFSIIQQNQWTSICAKPEDAYRSLLREFFANAMFCEEGTYFVRGTTVAITVDRIRQYYQLPAVSACKYQEMMRTPADLPLDRIKRRIRKSGQRSLGLQRSDLREAAKFWHYFLCHNVLPTSHSNKVSEARAVLIYCIMENHPIDLAAIIYNHLISFIKRMATSKTEKIFTMIFPHLISALCVRQNVPYSVLDKLEPPHAFHLASAGNAIDEEIALAAAAADSAEDDGSSSAGHDVATTSTPAARPPPRETFQARVLRELAELKASILQEQAELKATTLRELAEVKALVRALLDQHHPPPPT